MQLAAPLTAAQKAAQAQAAARRAAAQRKRVAPQVQVLPMPPKIRGWLPWVLGGAALLAVLRR